MKAYIANTDYDWYTFLCSQSEVDEVNFWKPLGGSSFRALSVGEPFFFKLKKAHGNAIAGFAFFVLFRDLRVKDVWALFGTRNGAPSLAAVWERIRHYMRRNRAEAPDLNHHNIGCVLLTSPVFFPPELWVEGPRNWHQSIVSGKGYDTSTGEGKRIWNDCLERASFMKLAADAVYNLQVVAENDARYGRERRVRPRLGQGTFRLALEQAYRKCAVTREHSLPALEASHIVPYGEGGTHEVSNGLLLRADIHKLYDRGYVTVTPDYQFKVSERLQDEYQNGKVYYQLDGSTIWLPEDSWDRPKREHLEYHASTQFLG